VTPDEVTAALAARKPMSAPNGSVDSWWGVWTKSTVVAVNLADDLWRVAEAAQAVARNPAHIGASVQAVQRLRKALAALAATREELP